MLEEYEQTMISQFKGLYARGSPEEVPKDHFVESQNLSFKPGSFSIRPGSSLQLDFGQSVNNIAEWVIGSAPFPVVGITNDGHILLYTPISVTDLYTVSGATDFYTINYFSRLFIAPVTSTGVIGNLLMLYLVGNTPTIRECGGDIPVGTMIASVNSAGGQIVTTAALSPTIVTQSGSLNGWFNLQNVTRQDATYASCTVFANPGANVSNIINVTGFDFSAIPSTANILGIEVKVYHKQLGGTTTVYDLLVTLSGILSNNKYAVPAWNISAAETFTYGGVADLWGATSISAADIQSQQFGVNFQAECVTGVGTGAILGVDYISVKVKWQTAAGNIAAGTYKIGLVYQTDTGFLTPPATSPGLNPSAVVTTDGSNIVLTNIPVGPSYVAARRIIIALVDSQGDVGEYFFIPTSDGGFINDNVTTSTTLSFFVTDLVESAEYLFNVRARIPSSQGLNIYSARLVLWGFPTPDESLLRLSQKADPETFDMTLESIVVFRDDGYKATNTAVLNSQLYIWKEIGIYATFDNDADPVNWDLSVVDQTVGCGFRGVSNSTPTVPKGMHSNIVIFADRNGAYLFNGAVIQPEISWKIEDLWQANDFNNVIIDVFNKRILFQATSGTYFLVIHGVRTSISTSILLVADFSEGISYDQLKWSIWTYHKNVRLLSSSRLNISNVVNILPSGKVIKLDDSLKTDYVDGVSLSRIDHFATLAGIGEGGISLIRAVTMRITGLGKLHASLLGEDNVDNQGLEDINLVDSPGKELTVYSNFMSEKAYIKLESQADDSEIGNFFNVSKIIAFTKLTYAERPA